MWNRVTDIQPRRTGHQSRYPNMPVRSLRVGTGEIGQAISELSRELWTNEIALFSIVLSAEFGQ
jgi:hypothetical protein